MKKIMAKIRHTIGILSTLKDDQAGVFIPNRQASMIAAVALVISFVWFMLGYFCGHKRAVDRFVAKIEEESFADRINYALYTMNNRDMSEFDQEEDVPATAVIDDAPVGADEQEENGEEQDTVDLQDIKNKNEESVQISDGAAQSKNEQVAIAPGTVLFVAPLAGFGTLHAATDFIKRVQLIDPNSTVEKRTSKTPKGRTITWYQAVTGEFETREDLQKFVSVIQKREHIKDIKIVEKRKG